MEAPPDEVLSIDQRSLHERILFEQLQEGLRSARLDGLRSGRPEARRLLIAETVMGLSPSLYPCQARPVNGYTAIC